MANDTKRAPAKAPAKRSTNSKRGQAAALKGKGVPAKAASKNQVAAKPAANGTSTKLREAVRAEYEAGATRGQLRAKHNLSYPQVYNMTKDLGTREHGRDRIVIKDPDNKGATISRRAAMRRDYAAGMAVGDIGRKYGVIYQVARQAVLDLLPEGGQRAAKAAPKAKATGKSGGKAKAKSASKAKATA